MDASDATDDGGGAFDGGSFDGGKGCLGVFCILGYKCCNVISSKNWGKCEPSTCGSCCI